MCLCGAAWRGEEEGWKVNFKVNHHHHVLHVGHLGHFLHVSHVGHLEQCYCFFYLSYITVG